MPEPSRAEPGRAGPGRAEPSGAEPSRAEASRAEASRAEPRRAEGMYLGHKIIVLGGLGVLWGKKQKLRPTGEMARFQRHPWTPLLGPPQIKNTRVGLCSELAAAQHI